MRRFWFGVSLVLVFAFAVSASYIFFVLTGGKPQVDEPYRAKQDVDVAAYQVARVDEDCELLVREHYPCGYLLESSLPGGGEFAGQSFDQLAADGWAVARVGEGKVEISRENEGICPIEEEKRLIKQTERGVAVYAGTAEHLGALLLEMPLNFDELPGNVLTALAGAGYQLDSPAELDELLESMDELIMRE